MNKKTKKREKQTTTQPDSAAPQIPNDLSNQWGAVEACATAWTLLKNATFKQADFKAVEMSMVFLQNLHSQSVEVAVKHPQAKLIPELKVIVEAQEKRDRKEAKKGNTDGKEETASH